MAGAGAGPPPTTYQPVGNLPGMTSSLPERAGRRCHSLLNPFHSAHYFSPDTLTWEGMEFGDSGLIEFLLTGDLDGFYGSFRWRHWAEDVAALSPDHGFHTYPPLRSKEGKDPEKVSRKPVEMTELVAVQWEYARQLANAESA